MKIWWQNNRINQFSVSLWNEIFICETIGKKEISFIFHSSNPEIEFSNWFHSASVLATCTALLSSSSRLHIQIQLNYMFQSFSKALRSTIEKKVNIIGFDIRVHCAVGCKFERNFSMSPMNLNQKLSHFIYNIAVVKDFQCLLNSFFLVENEHRIFHLTHFAFFYVRIILQLMQRDVIRDVYSADLIFLLPDFSVYRSFPLFWQSLARNSTTVCGWDELLQYLQFYWLGSPMRVIW